MMHQFDMVKSLLYNACSPQLSLQHTITDQFNSYTASMSQSSENLTFLTEDRVVCLTWLIIFIRWWFLPSITRWTKYVSCNVQISGMKYLGLLIWEIKIIGEMLKSPNLMTWSRFCVRKLGRWEAMEAHKTTDFLVDCFHMSLSHLY